LKEVALRQYARLPREYRGLEVLASTIDAYGRALWLLSDSPDAFPDDLSGSGKLTAPPRKQPYDALLVMDKNGTASELVLHDSNGPLNCLGSPMTQSENASLSATSLGDRLQEVGGRSSLDLYHP